MILLHQKQESLKSLARQILARVWSNRNFNPVLRVQEGCFGKVWLCDPMDCRAPGSSVHGILQARILEWVAMAFSRESSWPRDWTHISEGKYIIKILWKNLTNLNKIVHFLWLHWTQFSSVQSQSCPTLCDPTDGIMPDFPAHYQLPELTQTHVLRVGAAIQSSHPLSSPSPPAFNIFQHQGLFQWLNSSHQVAKVL